MKTIRNRCSFVLTTLLGAGASQAKGSTIKIGAIFSKTGRRPIWAARKPGTLEMLVQRPTRRAGWPAIRSS